jgi:hypothetical protein
MQIKIIPLTKVQGLPEQGELVKQSATHLTLSVLQAGRGRRPASTKLVHIPVTMVAWEETAAETTQENPAEPAPRVRVSKVLAQAETPKPRRGRPPKDKSVDQAETPKPRRGRPPKDKSVDQAETPKPRRGRPPKDKSVDQAETPKPRRGRPPKDKAPARTDDDAGDQHDKTVAAWNGDFKPDQVAGRPRKAAVPEVSKVVKPKVQATRRPFALTTDDEAYDLTE